MSQKRIEEARTAGQLRKKTYALSGVRDQAKKAWSRPGSKETEGKIPEKREKRSVKLLAALGPLGDASRASKSKGGELCSGASIFDGEKNRTREAGLRIRYLGSVIGIVIRKKQQLIGVGEPSYRNRQR